MTDEHAWGRMLYEVLGFVGHVSRVTLKPRHGAGTSYGSVVGVLRSTEPLVTENVLTDAEDSMLKLDGGTVGISRAEFTGYEWEQGALRIDTKLLSIWVER